MDQRLMIAQLSGQLTEAENEVRRLRVHANQLQNRLDGVMETNHFMALVTAFSAPDIVTPEEAIKQAVETMNACSAHFQAEFEKQKEVDRLAAEAKADAVKTEPKSDDEDSGGPAEVELGPGKVIDFPAGKEIAEKAVEKEGAD